MICVGNVAVVWNSLQKRISNIDQKFWSKRNSRLSNSFSSCEVRDIFKISSKTDVFIKSITILDRVVALIIFREWGCFIEKGTCFDICRSWLEGRIKCVVWIIDFCLTEGKVHQRKVHISNYFSVQEHIPTIYSKIFIFCKSKS